MKKRFAFILAGILFLAISVLMPSCKEEIYTDEEALAAMKEGLKYKNDLEKELLALQLTNQLQIINLQSQLSIKEMKTSDSLDKVGAKTTVSLQVKDVTGLTADLSGFDITVNQGGQAVTLKTNAAGFVVFPNFVQGTATFVAVKTGFVRTTGIIQIYGDYQESQQAVIVPVFPTDVATATISGTLTAQLNVLTPEAELFPGGIISLNFENIWDIFNDPNSSIEDLSDFGLMAVIYDGGFMQTVKTGADGKYSFKIPKTKEPINYVLAMSTIQKNQKMMFGDYPMDLDSIRVDSMKAWFGLREYLDGYGDPSYFWPLWDFIGYYSPNIGDVEYSGVNITIDAPAGGQKPTAAANIDWVHNDSTLVTWSFTKFNYTNGTNEFTNITQAPKFEFSPSLSLVTVVTPAVGVVDISGGKLNSLYMTNGGLYKEWGRNTGWVTPRTFANPVFKFLEQLSAQDDWTDSDTTYATALATSGSPVLKAGKVKIPFTTVRKGKGYTANPNVEIWVEFNTPGNPNPGDSSYYFTQADLKGMTRDAAGRITLDSLVLPAMFKTAAYVSDYGDPIISTAKYNNNWMTHGSWTAVTATATNTYKVDLLNGLKIADGGLGYTTAPSIRIQNFAKKQGTTNNYTLQTVATAATTIDAEGRIISIANPVMADNFVIQPSGSAFMYDMYSSYPEFVTVPVDVIGLTQAYARAIVDQYGTIQSVLLYNEDLTSWRNTSSMPNYHSGKGYISIPKIKVIPVGLASVATPAVLQAVVSPNGTVNNIIIVNGGKGYTVENDVDAKDQITDDFFNIVTTNGASDIVYDIDLGSGFHGTGMEALEAWWD